MSKEYTVNEAADLVGVSESRIRQLVLCGAVDHRYFGRAIVITEKGVRQAQARNTKPGPVSQKEIKAA